MTTTKDFVERNVVDPSGIVQVYKNYWWWCVEGDPTRAIFFVRGRSSRDIGSAQCNHSQEIAQAVGEKMDYSTWAQLVQIPLAFVPWKG